MRERWIRQILSLIVSGSMLFTGLYSCPPGLPVAKAAAALPEPVYEYDFENTDPDKGTIIGGGSLVNSGDPERGKVFRNMLASQGSQGANYFRLPEDVFSENAENMKKNKGMTISFFVNGNRNASLYAPLFTAYASSPQQGSKTDAMFVIQGTQQIRFNANGACDCLSKDNRDGFNCYSMDFLNDHKWHNITVTVSDKEAVYYVDGVAENIWDHDAPGFLDSKGIGTLRYLCLGGDQAGAATEPDALYQFDNLCIFDEVLDHNQIYKLMTGREPVQTDKEKLRSDVHSTNLLQQELYIEESLTAFHWILDKAKEVLKDGEVSQSEVDATERQLRYWMRINPREKKTVSVLSLWEGILVNTNFMTDTATIDKIKNCVMVNGYEIKPLGTSTIEKGCIQSSKNGVGKKAGISIDSRVLDGFDMEKGMTFHITWRFSCIETARGTDLWDLIAFVDSSGNMLMKNTIGFTFAVQGYPWLYPAVDVKNGFDWDSYKDYEKDIDMDFTLTLDKSGCRMYVNGILACEKTQISEMELENILAGTKDIVVGRDTGGHGDLMGGLHELRIYNRALDAAEVDDLAQRQFSYLSSGAVIIDTEPNSEVIISQYGKTVYRIMSDENGKAGIDNLVGGEYDITVCRGNEVILTKKLNIYLDKTTIKLKANNTDKKVATGKKQQDVDDNKTVKEVTLYTGNVKNQVMVKSEVSGSSRTVIWNSSNPKVASVSKGKIRAVKKGTALITAKANGISRSVKVKVKNPVVQIKRGKKEVRSCRIRRKKKMTLDVSVAPTGSGMRLKKLSQREKQKVKVKVKKGRLTVKGKKKGKIMLTVRSGGTEKKIKITVK